MHSLIEKAAKFKNPAADELESLFEALLDKQLAEMPYGTARWVFERYGLSGFISEVRLAEVIRFVRLQSSRITFGVKRSGHKDPRDAVVGVERWYQSSSLDAAGKADLVFWDGDDLVIVDFKLSLRLDESGNPKPEHIFQLGTYALIVEDVIKKKVPIRLELRSPQGQFMRDFTEDLRNLISQELAKLKRVLPRDYSFSLDESATLSTACQSCTFRSSCPRYRHALRFESPSEDDFLVPTDCAGRITKIEVKNELLSVFIRSLKEDRPLSIKGLPRILFSGKIELGECYEFIGLRSPEISGRGRVISNLHAVDEASVRDSSLSFSIRRLEV